jgi:hypothetical protein
MNAATRSTDWRWSFGVLMGGSVAALVVCGACGASSGAGADGDAGQRDEAGNDPGERTASDGAASDGAGGDDTGSVPSGPCLDAGSDDGAVLVSEDFSAGCDGWTLTGGVGFTLKAVATACGGSACEICATGVDAGGFAGTMYPATMFDGGSYTVSGWLLDRDAGPGASITLQASFFTASSIFMGSAQVTGALTSDWTFASSPPAANIEQGATQVQLGIVPNRVQVGGCMRISHVRVGWAPPP